MRGLFTAGVLDVFMVNDICFDGAIGVSAGAAFGCNIKSKQIGRVLRYNMAYCRDKRHASIFSLLLTGNLFSTKFNYNILHIIWIYGIVKRLKRIQWRSIVLQRM